MHATPRFAEASAFLRRIVAGCAALCLLFSTGAALAAGGALIGKTLTRIPGGDNYALRSLVQPDGKILIAGAARFGSLQYQITRYNADGSLDTTFATNGTILEPLGPGNGEAWAIALQSDGKIVVAGNVRSDKDRFGIARFNTDGTLDLSFGGGGSAKSAGPGDSGGFAMAIQPDGKIVVGGYSMTAASGGRKVFTVARYNADDTLDASFGSGGFVIAPAGSADEVIRGIGIQSDGKIVAAGTIAGGGVRMMRVTSAGAIDGTWATSSVSYMLGARDLVVQADNSVAIVGNVNGGSVSEVGVLHMTAAGAVDTSFGNGACAFGACPGIAHMPISDAATGYGIAIQSGKYVVSGDTADAIGRPGLALARFTSTGAIDTTFGTSGSTVVRPSGSGDQGRGLALRADGRIVVAGLASGSSGDYDSMVVAFTANGALDTTFNATGYSKLDVGSMTGEWRATALQGDGKIVAAGFTVTENHAGGAGTKGGVVARYLADGTLDTTFGTGGITQFAWPANAVAIQSDGRIVVGGWSLNGARAQMTFARFSTTGAPDAGFGTGGTVAIAPATANEAISALAIQGDGKIVGAGYVTNAFLDSVFVRLTSTGALDTTFNGSGKAVVAMSTGYDEVTALGIQADGKIVGAGSADISSSQDSMTVTRLTASGSVDGAFGTSGVANINFGTATSNAYALAIQPDGKAVIAGKVFNTGNSTDDFAIARLTTAGALDASFGTNGMMSSDFGNHNRIFALARLANGKLLGAGETGGLFALVQYLSSGALDIGFATNGATAQQINAGNDFANALVVGADGTAYAAGNGSGLLALARFTTDVAATTADLGITQSASPNPPTAGQNVTFTLTVSNAGPGAASSIVVTDTLPSSVTFVSASAGCSNASGTVTCNIASIASGASTQLSIVGHTTAAGTISNTAGVSGSQTDPNNANNTSAASITVNAPAPAPAGTVVNISTRGQVGTGNNVLIGGFVIGGSTAKTVVVVGIGPSLVSAGINNALPNPTLTLVRSSDGAVIGTNDDWQSASNASAIQAAGFAPGNALESAIMMTLPPGAYTAILSDAGGRSGVGIAAVYEVDHPEVPLLNISTRGQVLTGNDVMIGGFVIQGSAPRTVVVTGIGPSMRAAGVSNALANPTLTLVRSSDGAVIATNDDWGQASNASQIQAAGFAPGDSSESAIMMTLPPGAYTAVLSGVGGGTGVGIIAVYSVQ